MAQIASQKYWRKLEVHCIEDGIALIGIRSDHQLFRVNIPSKLMIPSNMKKFIEQLEAYRNCDCYTTKPCALHEAQFVNQ